VDSAQSKRNKFDACVINEMQGYWDVRTVRELIPDNPNDPPCKSESGTGLDCLTFIYRNVEKEIFVEPTLKEAEQSCVYLLD
jgi:hypothetical protein